MRGASIEKTLLNIGNVGLVHKALTHICFGRWIGQPLPQTLSFVGIPPSLPHTFCAYMHGAF